MDDSAARRHAANLRLGMVVPKRHARRAVTRSLIKREIRAAVARNAARGESPLPGGIYVVRLRAPFERAQFVSAASGALRDAVRGELDALMASLRARVGAASGATA